MDSQILILEDEVLLALNMKQQLKGLGCAGVHISVSVEEAEAVLEGSQN